MELYATKLGTYNIVLGIPWFRQHNPVVNWERDEVVLNSEYCKRNCISESGNSVEHQEETIPLEQQVPPEYQEWLHVFDRKEAEQLPPHRPGIDCEINLEEGKKVPNQPLYQLSRKKMEALDEYVEDMERKGFITEASVTAAAPMFFVEKKGGKLRPVVDYRKLNEITIKDKQPLPLTNQLIEALTGAKYFTKIDLRSGYNLIRIAPGDEPKTAFKTHKKTYQYNVMPFGLCNAPAVFQRFMNNIFDEILYRGIIVYLDDILVYATTPEQLEERTKLALKILEANKLYGNAEKTDWNLQKIEYLGIMVSENGIEMDVHKIDAIREWPTPKNLKEVQSFMGFCNFYRRFIENYSKIGRALFDLTKKENKYKKGDRFWNEKAQRAFENLKAKFEESPLLLHADQSKPFFLETDASDFATGAELSQIGPDWRRHPVVFMSKSLLPAERNYDIYDKELLAIIKAIKEWRHHLEGNPFETTVLTDHDNLADHKGRLTRRQACWAEFLLGFNIKIKYIPGKENGRADALPRRPDHKLEDTPELERSIFTPEQFLNATGSTLIESEAEILEQLTYTEEELRLMKMIRTRDKRVNPDWTLTEGLLSYKGRIVITKENEDARRKLMALYHDNKIAGHPGIKGTIELLQQTYYWNNMAQYIAKYIQSCDMCQRVKARRHKPYGELEPLQQARVKWEHISYDFIVGLPLCNGYDAILNVVDRHSKGAHFIPCTSKEDASTTAWLFIKEVWRLHGTPKSTISDRGTQFNSQFMKRLFEILGIKAYFSTAYHPQTDGQTERVNQEIEEYLQFYISHRQNNWVKYLPMGEFAYNNSVSETTGYSPFYLQYGLHPQFSIETPRTEIVPAAEELAKHMKDIESEANASITMAHERYKEQADKKRLPDPEFKEGDKVWLHRKNITTDCPSQKFEYRYLGPYKVLERIGKRAYRLELPRTLKIHDVFHVSLLEKWHKDEFGRKPIPLPPVITQEGEEEYEIDKVLNSRTKYGKTEYLISWKGYGPGENLWIHENEMGNAQEAIEEFYNKNPLAPRTKQTYTIPQKRNPQKHSRRHEP